MVIKQQLQVTNFAASLGRSQAGNPAITDIEWYNTFETVVVYIYYPFSKF